MDTVLTILPCALRPGLAETKCSAGFAVGVRRSRKVVAESGAELLVHVTVVSCVQ